MADPQTRKIEGLGVSDGVSLGKAVCINTRIADIYQIPLPVDSIDDEVERFRSAVASSRQEIAAVRSRVRAELGEDLAGIFDAQSLLLADSTFVEQVVGHIRQEHVNAEWALQETVAEIQKRFAEIEAPHLRDRIEDLRYVSRYVVRSLRGISLHPLSEVEGDVIIVADDLSPSDAVRLGREQVVGFAIEHGSRTSHTTIIARSLNIPAVLGVKGLADLIADRTEVPTIVDGDSGVVIIDPDRETRAIYVERARECAEREKELLSASEIHPVTSDGVEIRVMANIDLPEEIDDVARFGGNGVGLYRSEFLYIEKSPELPSEEDHVELYRRILESSRPYPAVIRTYDLGGRKIAREVMETREANPVLGLRGIRLTLARPNIFETQVRALLRASRYGDLWVMLPLVTVVDEVRQFKKVIERLMVDLDSEGHQFRRDFKLGVMIEVPAAALIADLLAEEVDFFSIGTNDLIQYSLAVDRNNEHVADLYQPLHPAIIRLLKSIVAAGDRAGIEVSLCGEMGADPRLTPVLLGCGLRRISVSPRRIPEIKKVIRNLSIAQVSAITERCADLATAAEVEAFLQASLE